MPREVFPYESDKDIINCFLRGKQNYGADASHYLLLHKGLLHQKIHDGQHAMAWFDTAGALYVRLQRGLGYDFSVHTIREMCKQLGLTDREIVRERTMEPRVHNFFKYFIGGDQVRLDEPYVLVGALGMAAWRVSNK
jgi:hypothetical protein